jgi:hypothetical protein
MMENKKQDEKSQVPSPIYYIILFIALLVLFLYDCEDRHEGEFTAPLEEAAESPGQEYGGIAQAQLWLLGVQQQPVLGAERFWRKEPRGPHVSSYLLGNVNVVQCRS